MYGLLISDGKNLSAEAKTLYRGFYCGLCRTLGMRYGFSARLCLSYDLTFAALFGFAVAADGSVPPITPGNCFLHPFKGYPQMERDQTDPLQAILDYTADVSILLTYAKCADDRADDGSLSAGAVQSLLKKARVAAENRIPEISRRTDDQLHLLSALEKENCLLPDLPADTFGTLAGEIFAHIPHTENRRDALGQFGYALGRAIYLFDAVLDFREDLAKKRYNPLLSTDSAAFLPILQGAMSDVTEAYSRFSVSPPYKDSIDSVLYSGIWAKYRIYENKHKPHGGNNSGKKPL